MFDADLNERQSRIDRVQWLPGRADVARSGVRLQRDDGQRIGAAGAVVQPELVPADRLVSARDWRGGGICCVDYHTLARWSMVAYWVAVLLLVVVLLFGSVRFGARRWFDLGFFSLQPSEFAKLAFILAQAHFLSRPVEELRALLTFWKAWV